VIEFFAEESLSHRVLDRIYRIIGIVKIEKAGDRILSRNRGGEGRNRPELPAVTRQICPFLFTTQHKSA